jgi:hypothetical protein
MIARRALAFFAGAALTAASLPCVAQELGRLFFTPEQRSALDARRKARVPDKPTANVVVSPTMRLDGYVKRSSGRSTVWVNREAKKRPNFLEPGDIDAALTTASAIGDDTLQRQSTGRVVPDSFTHGSAAQRKQWFMTGYQQGTVQACNTFGGGQ